MGARHGGQGRGVRPRFYWLIKKFRTRIILRRSFNPTQPEALCNCVYLYWPQSAPHPSPSWLLPNHRHPPGLIPAKTARNIGAILVRFMPLAASARTNHRWICPRWKQLPTIARNSIMSRCFIPSNITVTQFRRPLRKVCRHCIWATRFLR